MVTQREVKDALPGHIPFYSFTGDQVHFNDRRSTPGKNYLDPQEVLVRVYNATIAKDGGFSGEVIALGDHVDSFGMNDYVYGGGVSCLQRFITVKASEITTKPRDLCFADASRLFAGTVLYEALRHLKEQMMVLILGDMTGFAAQICRERGCFVTSSENFDCGEENIIEGDDFLDWLQHSKLKFDVVIDATGDLDLYDYCHEFTVRNGEYISIEPQNALQAATTSIWPTILGGGKRKLTVARAPKGAQRANTLMALASKVLGGEYEVKNQRIVAYEAVLAVQSFERYVTAVNVIKQSELTPDEADNNDGKEGRASHRQDKGKAPANGRGHHQPQTPDFNKRPRVRAPSFGTPDNLTSSPLQKSAQSQPQSQPQSQTQQPHAQSSPSLIGSPIMNPYSPRLPSRLSHSISASNLQDLERNSPSPPPFTYQPSPPQRVLSFGNRVSSPLLNTASPPRSPKVSIMARPPVNRRHTSAIDNDTSPFDSVDLDAGNDHGDPSSIPLLSEDDGQDESSDPRVVPGETTKEQELARAKEQIEQLQRQVERLMSKKSPNLSTDSTLPTQGLGLTLS